RQRTGGGKESAVLPDSEQRAQSMQIQHGYGGYPAALPCGERCAYR
ncbi:MAG: hypothetical protein V7637_4407, partial [Mycobacteriales bacterium]